MRSKIKTIILTTLAGFFIYTTEVFARAGGGGSGGGGGGGGGSHFSSSSGSSSGSGEGGWWPFVLTLLFFMAIFIFAYYKNKKMLRDLKECQDKIIKIENLDWDMFRKRVEDVFYNFEEAWGKFDLSTMKTLLTEDYYKRMVLELNVLQNEKRANIMENVKLQRFFIVSNGLNKNGYKNLIVQVTATARDILLDQSINKKLFTDLRPFTEFWYFVNQNNEWRLDLITQSTEDKNLVEGDIVTFAKNNGFYFDPDFGWLMMPNHGVIFGKTNFGRSDINNHVIGYYREKIVEFYTYIPDTNSNTGANYLVAQTILPISYNNILVKKKKWPDFAPRNLRKIELESIDFNNKFNLWADQRDQVSSLELLTPNFMEKIYNLPFELNIEIVGNFLYFYTKDRGLANYDKMLEIISWAFDEMKM